MNKLFSLLKTYLKNMNKHYLTYLWNKFFWFGGEIWLISSSDSPSIVVKKSYIQCRDLNLLLYLTSNHTIGQIQLTLHTVIWTTVFSLKAFSTEMLQAIFNILDLRAYSWGQGMVKQEKRKKSVTGFIKKHHDIKWRKISPELG